MIPTNEQHQNHGVLQRILAQVVEWQIPALVLFSDHDSVFSPGQGQRFAGRMKQASFKLIPGPKHFLQYQAADRVAVEIKAFLEGENDCA